MFNDTTWDDEDDWDTYEEPKPDGDPCDGCGERFSSYFPNRGDGWAEMAGPGVDCFTGHYQCGQARGLELA
jgi:hypothetical protein